MGPNHPEGRGGKAGAGVEGDMRLCVDVDVVYVCDVFDIDSCTG